LRYALAVLPGSLPRRLARLLPLLLALPSCLVSFNDYPLGEIEGEPGSGGKAASGGTTNGGLAPGGSAAQAGAPDDGAGAASTISSGVMLDDFEDGNAAIPERDGRSGSWYVANDGRGTQTPRVDQALMPTPLMPVRQGSSRGVHTFGGPFLDWGALVGTNLATSNNARAPYDVSRFTGIALWVRSGATAPSAARSVRLNLLTPATVPGGACSSCNDHFGAPVPLTAQWERVEIRFADLEPMGFGIPRPTSFDARRVLALELVFARNTAFDVWVDDIELF
jgi:hypothetical protein